MCKIGKHGRVENCKKGVMTKKKCHQNFLRGKNLKKVVKRFMRRKFMVKGQERLGNLSNAQG